MATPTLWTPARVLVTRSASELPHGADDRRAVRGRRRCRHRRAVRRPAAVAARRGRPRRLRTGQAHARRRRGTAEQAPTAADPAERRLADRPRRGLPGALPVLLSGRLAVAARRSPGCTRTFPRSSPRWTSSVGHGTVTSGLAGARGGGHHVRGLLLHRPARARTPHRVAVDDDRPRRHPRLAGPGGAAVHHEVRRRRTPARPAARRPHPGPGLGQRRRGRQPLRRRHGPPAATHLGAPGARPRRLPGGPDHRPDHAGARLARRLRIAAARRRRRRWPTSPTST